MICNKRIANFYNTLATLADSWKAVAGIP